MSAALIFDCLAALFGSGLAIAAVCQARRSLPRWAFAAGMAVLAIESVMMALARQAPTIDEVVRWQVWRMLAMAFIPGCWLVFSQSYARAKGEKSNLWHRARLVGSFAIPFALVALYRNELVVPAKEAAGGSQWLLRLEPPGNLLFLVMLVGAVGVVVNLERTFRASVGTMRWRIKYVVLGVGMLFIARIYTSSQVLLFRGIDSSLESIGSGALIVAALLIARSFFRAGHFDMEVYPSQAVLQKSLTVLIAGAYLLIVGVLAKVVTHFGGDTAFATKAFLVLVSLVVLAILLQSDRARLQLRQFVSRNFQRSAYDYRAVWKTFMAGTASRVEQSDLAQELVRLTAETCQALSVSIWLMDERKESLLPSASTIQSTRQQPEPAISATDTPAMFRHFERQPEPIDIDAKSDDWILTLRKLHPGQFAHGGNRVCVPMMGHGELLGILIVGDRVGGVPFSADDLDMLKCIGDHAAAGLLTVQLSKKLLQAKELEAFQAMAAFFVHDLKNSASTLNLMLKNLPVHFDDPEFRQDALRGISKTVSHINGLISRLGLLRGELKIERVDSDLNEVVNNVLAGLERASGLNLIKDLRLSRRVALDRDQMQKVITNLVLNAAEAVAPEEGRVHVTTGEEGEWAVLTVADNGCGMSADFLAHSLFRPFQTTKKNGLGIGMFQSKMIVEAHGGRITVTSEQGKGTTFRLFLRATASN